MMEKSLDLQVQPVFGFPIFAGTRDDCYTLLEKSLQRKEKTPHLVFSLNPEQLMFAQRNTQFAETLQKGDILLPDGVGVVWASKLLHGTNAIKDRVSGREAMAFLIARAAELKLPVFLLGGRTSAKEYAKKLHHHYPDLQVVWDAGAEDAGHETPEERQRIATLLKEVHPALVCVAYGAPQQEFWMTRNRELLSEARVQVVMAVGGAFDVYSGRIALPPKLVVSLGLEWLWRLILEPWRAKRQVALPQFAIRVLKEKLRQVFRA